MNPHRQRTLVASVPEDIAPEQRARLLAHVATADDCRVRLERARADLDVALRGGGSALDLALQLDRLERVQERVDGWLAAVVDELAHGPRTVRYHDGVPA